MLSYLSGWQTTAAIEEPERPVAPDERVRQLLREKEDKEQATKIREVSAMLAELTAKCQRVVLREQKKRKQLRAEMRELEEQLHKLAPGDPAPGLLALLEGGSLQRTGPPVAESLQQMQALTSDLSNPTLKSLLDLEKQLQAMVEREQKKTAALRDEVEGLRSDLSLLQPDSSGLQTNAGYPSGSDAGAGPSCHADPTPQPQQKHPNKYTSGSDDGAGPPQQIIPEGQADETIIHQRRSSGFIRKKDRKDSKEPEAMASNSS